MVVPVVEKVFVICEYGVFGAVEYLHVEFSSVFRDIVVCVVPCGSVPDGEGFDLVGGVVSAGGGVPVP